MRLAGKNILIVGASSGIGAELAALAQAEGATVYTAGRKATAFHHLTFDALQPDATNWSGFLPETLHGVVYCPGTIQLKPFQRISQADFLQELQVNLLGYVAVVQACLKPLKAAQGASVVSFSTVAAKTGMSFHAGIAAAKAGLEGLNRSLAAELASANIRFNCIAPSLTDTPLAGNLLSTPEKRTAAGQRHPLGSIGMPEDHAHAALFLLSGESRWITGQTLAIDGGMSVLR